MSAYNRYNFAKKIYHNYLIILTKGKKYYSFDNDKKILEYIKFNNNIYTIKKRKINFLVLDELDIIIKKEYQDNMLDRYIYLIYIEKILNRIKVLNQK